MEIKQKSFWSIKTVLSCHVMPIQTFENHPWCFLNLSCHDWAHSDIVRREDILEAVERFKKAYGKQ